MIIFFIVVQMIASIIIFIAANVSEHIFVQNPFKNVIRLITCLFISFLSPYFIIGAIEGFHGRNFITENDFFVLLASMVAFILWQLVFYDLFNEHEVWDEVDDV